jgi:hypothetical protein
VVLLAGAVCFTSLARFGILIAFVIFFGIKEPASVVEANPKWQGSEITSYHFC